MPFSIKTKQVFAVTATAMFLFCVLSPGGIQVPDYSDSHAAICQKQSCSFTAACLEQRLVVKRAADWTNGWIELFEQQFVDLLIWPIEPAFQNKPNLHSSFSFAVNPPIV